jgi:hypothetical protein
MYELLAHFLKTFSADQPVLWALLVMAMVATTSLTLYAFWELVWSALGGLFPGDSPKKSGRGSPE